MGIPGILVSPPHCLPGLDEQPDRIEPDEGAVGIAAHGHVHWFSPPGAHCPEGQSGEETPADLQDGATRQDHWATRASSDAGTCHSTTCACGFSTPG
jgi:hypothetical protein